MNRVIIICFYFSIIFMQDIRYLDEIFDNVDKTEDVVYGNSPDLPFIFLFEWNTQDLDLTMDIYEPQGDTLSNRPAIIFMHSGSFFAGSNDADDVVDLLINDYNVISLFERHTSFLTPKNNLKTINSFFNDKKGN